MEKRAALAAEVDQTIKQLINNITNMPAEWRNYNDLAVVLTQISDYNSAEELTMKALGLFATDEEAQQTLFYTLANVYYSAGEYQKAVEYYQKVAQPEIKGDAFVMLAQSFMAQQQYQQALVYALTAHEVLPADKQVITLLGDICLALGDFTNADAYYDQALANQQNPGALFGRGLVALASGDARAADVWFAKVKAVDMQFYQDNQQRVDEIATVLQQKHTPKI